MASFAWIHSPMSTSGFGLSWDQRLNWPDPTSIAPLCTLVLPRATLVAEAGSQNGHPLPFPGGRVEALFSPIPAQIRKDSGRVAVADRLSVRAGGRDPRGMDETRKRLGLSQDRFRPKFILPYPSKKPLHLQRRLSTLPLSIPDLRKGYPPTSSSHVSAQTVERRLSS